MSEFVILDDICLSGGAEGADLQWGMCAGMAGHTVIHYGFQGHRSKAPASEIVTLPDDLLDEANDPCERAAIGLQRRFPPDIPSKRFVRNLLRRNYFQVKDAERVYAVANIDAKGFVSGGTAWATQMFIDRHNGAECECYVFDQSEGAWFQWVGVARMRWMRLDDGPPVPHGVWAGIGSRDLLTNGKQAIRTIMSYVPPLAA